MRHSMIALAMLSSACARTPPTAPKSPSSASAPASTPPASTPPASTPPAHEPPAHVPPPENEEETIGLSNAGTIPPQESDAATPSTSTLSEQIRLDKEGIRLVVRANIEDVRGCYNAGLVKDPNLEGRVSIEFTIGPDGRVAETKVVSSTLPDSEVATCIASAAKQWQFAEPAGGANVVVTYPFVLVPG